MVSKSRKLLVGVRPALKNLRRRWFPLRSSESVVSLNMVLSVLEESLHHNFCVRKGEKECSNSLSHLD
ncbi:hypothetical protein MPTK1_4g06620 [Marchantia polymorpha subsp. ruderalis]|uniref:Uncharacterized protein n=2 Tax=Marchantia polymorpha TaxID=3197 RepID=A0AAF6B737_MARPO|nr:hypothetical protein MARPO_0125s0007 [Marchantia polymorpha]BBN07821.1 hypothetical protein Mp_4g06620 [Marchantia polymorpha subsp. ruderalis]|eukprot:PTQ30355.1 hypothetical protein MARPO_0125s0007 [Marchantia polymorpha]